MGAGEEASYSSPDGIQHHVSAAKRTTWRTDLPWDRIVTGRCATNTAAMGGHPAIETPWTVRPRWLTATGGSSPSAVYSLDYLLKSPGL